MGDFSSAQKPTLYDLIIFDWDGTAVPDRESPIPDLLAALNRVLKDATIVCVVVTGTNAQNILDQGLSQLTCQAKQSLYLCTNRGSEVWGFNPSGVSTQLYKRQATSAENHALDHAAISLQRDIEARGVKSEVVFKRLNRRKVDLIPETRWANPKKSEFRELLRAVTERLETAGINGGIAALIEDAYHLARVSGLRSPRITSDIKHIEIGLTDKSDSMKWVFQNLIQNRNTPLNRVAVFGDEFGSIGGIQGSDALLHIPELKSAKYISVGVEPEGVPPFIEYWGGGPTRFIQFIHSQANARRAPGANEQEIAWQIIQEGFEPSREREMETLFAIGNGYLGVRGAGDFALPTTQADLFLAGVYDKKATILPYSEVEFLTDKNRTSTEVEIVPFPSPFRFQLRVSGTMLSSETSDMKTQRRNLSLKNGTYQEEHLFEDSDGRRTRLQTLRLASAVDPHLLIQNIRIHCENYSAPIEIDFSNRFQESLYPHLESAERIALADSGEVLLYRTKGSDIACAMVSRTLSSKGDLHPTIVCFDPVPGEIIEFYRITSIFTDRDTIEPTKAASEHALSRDMKIICRQIQEHSTLWNQFWSHADVTFKRSPELNQAQRFNLYHLKIAADHDPRSSIPAKALTGRAYEGHVFWDTEIFMFPFFLYTEPDIAKSLLMYRFNTLGGARKRAKKMGFRGACYAWESTVSGEDMTPSSITLQGGKENIPIFTGAQQIHITADVAFAVWKYWDATLDLEFLAAYGAEILVETARFWVSRVSQSADGSHILEVVGPDEYHHDVQDNAYTNWMAKFNLATAAWACLYLKEKSQSNYHNLVSRLKLEEKEITSWQQGSKQIFTPRPNEAGVIEQFRGFHALRDTPLREHERHHAPISRLFAWKEINQLKLIKQADVLMIPFLFPESLSKEVLRANYDYYEPITDHGSSLSPCVHAAIAARIGRANEARNYWDRSLNFDLNNTMSNTALGIHVAAMGGAWQALAFHILGITPTENGPVCTSPLDPDAFSMLGDTELRLFYRGKRYRVSTDSLRRRAA